MQPLLELQCRSARVRVWGLGLGWMGGGGGAGWVGGKAGGPYPDGPSWLMLSAAPSPKEASHLPAQAEVSASLVR
jgi:hypothetical protein